MEKFKQLRKIRDIYKSGGNIIQYLRKIGNQNHNAIEDILISYDFQSGTYIRDLAKNDTFKNQYCQALATILKDMAPFNSIIEIGVGEATTLNTLLLQLDNIPEEIYGLDLSWSRLKFGMDLLREHHHNATLFTANLFEIPLPDHSIDVVYTSHSIEPNGGKEEEALRELYRIAGKYIILLEPAYELAEAEARQRMHNHGYITNLYATAKRLNYKILEHRLFEYSANPLNPTGLLIIEKEVQEEKQSTLVCPISYTPLTKLNDTFLYAKESFLAYPVLEDIPCLLKENSILATHLLTDYEKFKEKYNIDFGIN